MNNEFKKINSGKETRYVLETTSGGTSTASVASNPAAGFKNGFGVQSRKPGDNLLTQESDKKKVPAEKPRNFVAKNAKMGGAGAHKKKESDIPRKAKHKKPFMEGYDDTDQEVSMAGSELYGAAKHAKQLLALIQQHGNTQGLEAWQQSKITKAADYLNSVLQSLDYDTSDNHSVSEGAVKELIYDIKNMSDQEFQAKYHMTKAEARKQSSSAEGLKEMMADESWQDVKNFGKKAIAGAALGVAALGANAQSSEPPQGVNFSPAYLQKAADGGPGRFMISQQGAQQALDWLKQNGGARPTQAQSPQAQSAPLEPTQNSGPAMFSRDYLQKAAQGGPGRFLISPEDAKARLQQMDNAAGLKEKMSTSSVEGVGQQEGYYEFTTTILNPNFNIDDENSPEEIDIKVTYDVEGEHHPATWGYHGGEPEENPELNIMTVTDLENGQEILDTLESNVIDSLDEKAWSHYQEQEPDFDDSTDDDYYEGRSVMENTDISKQLAVLEKQLSNAEVGLRRAREITRQIKYDSVSMNIVSEITELAKSLGLEDGIKYGASNVMEAERALEAAVYELEESFEDHVRGIRWKIDDLEDQEKYPQESLQEKMMPASMFAGSKKNKLGTAGQWRNKGSKKNSPAKAGDLVGGCAQESIDPYLNGLTLRLESAVRKGK